MQLKTRMHQHLEAGQTAGGFGFALNSPEAVEFLLQNSKPDFIVIDAQHAPITPADAAHLLRAAQSTDPLATPIVRVPCHDLYWIQQMLDLGYMGLIVPLCESAEQARALAQATYYPPQGLRSIAGSIRANMYDQYIDQINEHVLLLPQIESRGGLENVEDIVAVEGVSGVLLGPADLSFDCGWREHTAELWSYPPFVDAVSRIRAACDSHGKLLATMVGGEAVFHAQQAGTRFICTAVDTGALRTGVATETNATIERLHTESGT